ncbi:DUF6271 family protein [Clostridium sp. E02]|uniref:DUF6271 family protein n=1 Tax=Clostridium sp. E02 TaxID=2487134 RepID=UPI000F528C2B|nr:DUF6271 family protein [Clostridium sp. E02]
MNKHVYTIGTERRLIPEFVGTYFKEIENMQKTTNEETTLVIIDECNDEAARANDIILKKNKRSGVNYIHFDKEKQYELFHYLRNNCSDSSIVDLLDFEGYSYGRVMNKQFLVASMLNANFLHRRDSDVKIIDDTFGFPSKFENKYLGKKVKDVNYHVNGKENHSLEQVIYMVGSGYSGKSSWKADFGIFLEKDMNLISEVAKLFNYDDSLMKEYMNEIVDGNVNIEGDELFLPLHNHPNPVCGNISMYEVFKHLPCSTMESTIGSDNLIREFLKRVGMPIIYHSNFVYHEFGKDRDNSDIKYLLSYWPRMINKLIYYKMIENLIFKNQKLKSDTIKNVEDVDFKNLINREKLTYDYVYSTANECIDLFVNIMKKGKNFKFKLLIEHFQNEEFLRNTADNMYNGMVNGDKLLRDWEEIIYLCENYSVSKDTEKIMKIV